jgi:regulator of nucleoside diphosphate kinase
MQISNLKLIQTLFPLIYKKSKQSHTVKDRKICISKSNLHRLDELQKHSSTAGNREITQLHLLQKELQKARVVVSKDIPKDVVTMNSTVRLSDVHSAEKMTYTLAYPINANINLGRISVLSPIGKAMIGRRIGDTIKWKSPIGLLKLKIERILYQPEEARYYSRKI